MKVYGGSICGHKKQGTQFVQTGQAKGSYPLYVCTLPSGSSSTHHKHYDKVHNVHF